MATDLTPTPNTIAAILGEARGEGFRGMRAVAHVMVNRARRRRKSLDEIVTQPKQFSAMNSQANKKKLLNMQRTNPALWKTAVKAANAAITSKDDPTGGADHYYAHSLIEEPYWARDMATTTVVGGHTFLNSRKKRGKES